MSQKSNFLVNIRRIIKLHETMLKQICQDYHLSLIEATIISFLYNNPGKDTAADIVELRMLSKGNVSQAVESLIQKCDSSAETGHGRPKKNSSLFNASRPSYYTRIGNHQQRVPRRGLFRPISGGVGAAGTDE